ncbi:MAG: dihydroneopterin aldolase [Planctomycetes bacterium]|nr:dihydroneopterin aldolase [Planctomycetota bacterium]
MNRSPRRKSTTLAAADRIDVAGLAVRTRIGIYDEERLQRQEVVIDMTLVTDIARPAATDRIADAVDYKQVTKRVIAFVENSSCALLEKLTEDVARLLLAEFDVAQVTVRIAKPGALRHAASVAVTVTRSR